MPARPSGALSGVSAPAGPASARTRVRKAESVWPTFGLPIPLRGTTMRIVAEVNKYISESAPWKLKDDPDRMGTILYVALQAVSDCNTLLTPFLPHAAQKIHELLGGTGVHAPMPSIVEVSDLDGGPDYPILTGDYSVGARWEPVGRASGSSSAVSSRDMSAGSTSSSSTCRSARQRCCSRRV